MVPVSFIDVAAGTTFLCELNNDTEHWISMVHKGRLYCNSRCPHKGFSIEVVDRIFGIFGVLKLNKTKAWGLGMNLDLRGTPGSLTDQS